MSFINALKVRLVENGLPEDHATKIMETAIEDDSFSCMTGHWSDDVSTYPSEFMSAVFSLLRPIAYKWICEHTPMAWFRIVFSPVRLTYKDDLAQYIHYIDSYYAAKQNNGVGE